MNCRLALAICLSVGLFFTTALKAAPDRSNEKTPFVSTWKTITANESITLSLVQGFKVLGIKSL